MRYLKRLAVLAVVVLVFSGLGAVPAGAALGDGSITGRVSLDATGAGVADAWVCAYGLTDPFDIECDLTDADGAYTLSLLADGTYDVSFEGIAPWGSFHEVRSATLIGGGTVSGLDLVLVEPPPAGAVITTGRTSIGLNREGDLNYNSVGLAFDGNDGIFPGCPCEGWGAGDAHTQVFGKAGQSFGTANVAVESFAFTTNSAVSVTTIAGPSADVLRVTHDFHPSEVANIFEVTVTIENLSDAEVDPRYRRAMDWDIPPTEFYEYVTIQGTDRAENVLYASDNGFADGNPFDGPSSILFEGDAVDSGPFDHGALFDFGFDPIAPGESTSFNIYYGAAQDEATANAALATLDVEVYSFGQPSSDGGAATGVPNTFLFAFAGVGGQVQFPNISGTVIGPDGQPLPNVQVWAYADTDGFEPTAKYTTAADGTYAIGDLPPGTYRLVFLPEDNSTLRYTWFEGPSRWESTPLVVDALTSTVNPHVEIDEALVESEASISGTVTGPSGSPVTGAQVWLYAPDDGWVGTEAAVVRADGSFEIPAVLPGTYRAVVYPPPGSGLAHEWYDNVRTRTTAADLTFVAGTTHTIAVELPAL